MNQEENMNKETNEETLEREVAAEETAETAEAAETAAEANAEAAGAAAEEHAEEAKEPEAPDELAIEKDRYLRLAAEYDNFRKRTIKEKTTLYRDAQCDTVAAFLPVYDNLLRAATAEGDDENPHKKGLVMILTQYQEVLKKLGVSEIPALHEPFDPAKHDAVMHTEDESLGENTVAQVFQPGFEKEEKIIRRAVVQVAN